MTNTQRLAIELPFKSMDWGGWHDDVERELEELAWYYHDDYISTLGKATGLSLAVFSNAVFDNFDEGRAHIALANEMVVAIDAAVLECLGRELDSRFESLSAPRATDGEWRVIASVRAIDLTSLPEETATPRLRYDAIMEKLARTGCDGEEFLERFFTSSEIYFAASCGIDFDNFIRDIKQAAIATDGHFEHIWRFGGEVLN